jgi:hypothetical protein
MPQLRLRKQKIEIASNGHMDYKCLLKNLYIAIKKEGT